MIVIIIGFSIFFQDTLPVVLSGYAQDTKAIIVFAPDNRSGLYSQSMTMLTRDPLGIDTRNIKIFEVFFEGGIGPMGEPYSSEEVTSIRTFYDIHPSDFYIVLSYRNFKEIFRSDEPLDIQEIFKQFDNID